MALNPKMILASDLQSYFVDKTTGEPLSYGVVTFYEDASRSTKKPVYQLTGSVMTGYTYTALKNPITLTAVGTMADELNNDIVIYYYPFEGTPDEDSDVVQNYYVTVDSSAGVRQFTREAWPSFTGDQLGENDEVNFIPNGQFLFHNDGDAQAASVFAGNDVTDIAQGGWTMEVQTGSGAYTSTFTRVQSGAAFLNDFPRFLLNYACTSAAAGDRDVRIKWRDVNSFEGSNDHATLGEQTYTLFFFARSNDGNSYTFDLRRIKYFGSNADAADPTPNSTEDDSITTFTITPSTSYFNIPITFDSNLGKIVGTNNDDYIQLALRAPASTFDINLTDFGLFIGELTLSTFPPKTQAQMLAEGMAGWMPVPAADGSDAYLPLISTPSGMTFDHSEIAKIRMSPETTPVNNELLCNGSQYKVSDYSSLGIPYNRLFTKLYDSTVKVPLFGTGADFATAYVNAGQTDLITLATNKTGTQTNPANGAASPGFTYQNLLTGAASFDFKSGTNESTFVTNICQTAGVPLAALSAGTSTMTVTDITNVASTRYVFQVTALAASTFATAGTGLYFDFSNTTTSYRMWFNTGGESAPAAGGRTLIECGLDPQMSAADVAIVIANCMNGYKADSITTTAAASITTGDYFSFYANSQQYVVWYNKDSGGGEPSVGSAINIEVAVTTGDTAAQIADATRVAINSTYFAVPDMRGLGIRGYDDNNNWDTDTTRISQTVIRGGMNVGTIQLDTVKNHIHSATSTVPVVDGAGGAFAVVRQAGGAATGTVAVTTTISNVSPQAQFESRIVNMNVNFFIKY